MLKLTDEFNDVFKWNGILYHVNLNFDNVLLLFEMFNDNLILRYEKPLYAVEMLIEEEIEISSYEEAISLFNFLLKEFLGIDTDGDNNKNSEGNKDMPKKKIFDYNKDAGLIYASFLSCYGIDLFEMKGKLHWNKFVTLVNHLDDNSKLKQVIGFREMKIPNSKEASKEYIDHVRKMKRVYSLEDEDNIISNKQSINNALNVVSAALKGKAKLKNNK